MSEAIAQARLASATGDVPVAALVVDDAGETLAVGRNERELLGDPTAHAEIVAIRRAAAARGSWRLDDVTLVVTLEPCAMCAGAILQARIPRVVFGAWDEKAGAVGSVNDLLRDRRLPHKVEVLGGVREAECAELLVGFFEDRR
jgi:tRNA(adenine34) deaminase